MFSSPGAGIFFLTYRIPMITQHFVLFERHPDPARVTPVGVYTTRVEAEDAQLSVQQDMAASYNVARHDRFTRGDGFPAAKEAADYQHALYITEVLTP